MIVTTSYISFFLETRVLLDVEEAQREAEAKGLFTLWCFVSGSQSVNQN